jgi:hypothetical protein
LVADHCLRVVVVVVLATVLVAPVDHQLVVLAEQQQDHPQLRIQAQVAVGRSVQTTVVLADQVLCT